MSSITFHAPAKAAAPRVAVWASETVLHLAALVQRALHRPAPSSAVDPRVAEAARLRAFAQKMMGEDPRFAADLFAAADQHERS